MVSKSPIAGGVWAAPPPSTCRARDSPPHQRKRDAQRPPQQRPQLRHHRQNKQPPPQPALYEAFGLTVVEAMSCGLPTFATAHGGPSEIIRHGRSGFHIDPYHGDQVMWGAM